MKAPARILCPECLRSVEWPSHTGATPTGCPHCGSRIEGSIAFEEDADSPDWASALPLDLTPTHCPWDLPSSTEFVPETVGRFQMRAYVGGGGFGQVFRAYDPRLDREVALKVLKDSNPSARTMERFFREARVAAQLDHPNIVALHDAGRDDGRCWIAYQYVRGPTLAAQLQESAVEPRRAAAIIHTLAGALEHAHRRGIFHRDLKPSNIMIDEREQPRLTDFGLARRTSNDPSLTSDGAVLGTPAYMSPEQAAGRGNAIDARSDVYSLGIIFYEMLCGQRPCDMPSSVPAWRVDPFVRAIPPRRVRRGVPRALDRICRKALAADPAARYPSARGMELELAAWLCRRHRWAR